MYKILIVEDEEKIKSAIAKELQKWGFEVLPVEDYNTVLEQFVHYSPHLVLMDINLPFRDGFYWCRKIRELSKVPLLFLSARSTSMDIVMAVGMGGDDYITKPFSMEVLVAKVNAILRRTYSYMEATADAIECGGAVLSLKEHTLHFKDQVLELTRNEHKILSVLMRSNGSVVSREKIIKELWDDEDFIDDNTLTVNVNRLRKRLNEIGLEDFIKTVKNQGYEIK